VSSTNLLNTEQISVGGPDLLRGYDPNSINGDEGVVVSNELRTPSFALLPANLQPGGIADEMQLLAFWDYAALHAHQDFAGDQNGIHASSIGLGLRAALGRYLAVKLDYGWQLQELPGQGHGQFGFVAITAGY
jgi:hemolysin activation/secretion protein